MPSRFDCVLVKMKRRAGNVMTASPARSRIYFCLSSFFTVVFVPFIVLFVFARREKYFRPLALRACVCVCVCALPLAVCLVAIRVRLTVWRDTKHHHIIMIINYDTHKNKHAEFFSLACTRCRRASPTDSTACLSPLPACTHNTVAACAYTHFSLHKHVSDCVLFSLNSGYLFYLPLATLCIFNTRARSLSFSFSHLFPFCASWWLMRICEKKKILNKQIYDSFMQKMQFEWCFSCAFI